VTLPLLASRTVVEFDVHLLAASEWLYQSLSKSRVNGRGEEIKGVHGLHQQHDSHPIL